MKVGNVIGAIGAIGAVLVCLLVWQVLFNEGVGKVGIDTPLTFLAAPEPRLEGPSMTGPSPGILAKSPENVVLFDPATTSTLADTEVDGGLEVDVDGNFIPSTRALQLFNYLLLASGEVPDEVAIATIRNTIMESLTDPARHQALAFLDQFLNFRELAKLYYVENGQPSEASDGLALLDQFRRAAFGDELTEALFGEEYLIDQLRLARSETMRSPDLTAEEKQQAIKEINQQLPPEVRATYQRSTQPSTIAKQVAAMRLQGDDGDAIRQVREEAFGPAAADRLLALDQKRAQWTHRVEDYQQQREAIVENSALTAQEQERRVTLLREEHFTAQESLRVVGIDDAL